MKIIPREGGGYTVMTNTGWHLSKEVVVAAGAWSCQLLGPLGMHLPPETERGYHAMLTSPGIALKMPISNKTRAFGATPMEHGARCRNGRNSRTERTSKRSARKGSPGAHQGDVP
jgi:glycine/D-amino acid oxidase-like deaminating enzyme